MIIYIIPVSNDFEKHLKLVKRSVTALEIDGKPARAVILSRNYETDISDLWDAITNPERIHRWFAPITGDLSLGGKYQIQGNAGGKITTCKPPTNFELTWEMGGGTSWVEVQLVSKEPNLTELVLTHTAYVTDHWKTYGPGAVGVGWDLSLLGLALYIDDPTKPKVDENKFATSSEGKSFMIASGKDWGHAAIALGEETEQAINAAKQTISFYTGEEVETI